MSKEKSINESNNNKHFMLRKVISLSLFVVFSWRPHLKSDSNQPITQSNVSEKHSTLRIKANHEKAKKKNEWKTCVAQSKRVTWWTCLGENAWKYTAAIHHQAMRPWRTLRMQERNNKRCRRIHFKTNYHKWYLEHRMRAVFSEVMANGISPMDRRCK